jgi:hypothetical protein
LNRLCCAGSCPRGLYSDTVLAWRYAVTALYWSGATAAADLEFIQLPKGPDNLCALRDYERYTRHVVHIRRAGCDALLRIPAWLPV